MHADVTLQVSLRCAELFEAAARVTGRPAKTLMEEALAKESFSIEGALTELERSGLRHVQKPR